MALDAVLADLREGRYTTAKARVEVLREAWARFEDERGYVGNGIGNIMVEFRDMPRPEEAKQDTEPTAAADGEDAAAEP